MDMTFSKYKGKSVHEVFKLNRGYFDWMKEQGMNDKDEYLHYIEMIPNLYPESFLWDVDVRSGYECWKCHKTMDIMLFFNPELENGLEMGIRL
jgi:hypothetical protein